MLILYILITTTLSQTLQLKRYTTEFKISDPKTSEMHNFVDEYYYVNIGVGNPLQNFSILIDLNSPFTWIADNDCLDCKEADHLYNSTLSTTDFRSESFVSVNTSRYNITGEIISERLRLNDQIDADNFSILRALNVSNFESIENDGVLGLAPGINDSSKFNLHYQLFNKSIVPSNSFSLFFTSNFFDLISTTEPPSTIVFGGADLNRFAKEDMTYINSKPDSNIWETEGNQISLDFYSDGKIDHSEKIRREPISVKFSTSTNWVVLPHREFNLITEAITNDAYCYMISEELYCAASSVKKFPHINIEIDGYNFDLDPENYIQGSSSMSRVLFKKGNNQEVVLGLPFFRGYYSFFDSEKRIIGLALAVKNYVVIVDGGNTGTLIFGLVAIAVAGYGLNKLRRHKKDDNYFRI